MAFLGKPTQVSGSHVWDGSKFVSAVTTGSGPDNDWTLTGSTLFTTSSIVVGQQSTTNAAGEDVFFFVSGTFGSGSATDNIALFGGDVKISGTLAVGTGSAFIQDDRITFTSASMRNVGGELKFFDGSNTQGLTLTELSGGGGSGQSTTSSLVQLSVVDYATTDATSSNPAAIGQALFNAAEYTGDIILRAVLSAASSSVTSSIRLLNVTSGSLVEIDGAGDTILSSVGSQPTIVESVNLRNAANFSTGSAIYELQAFTSDASQIATIGAAEFRTDGLATAQEKTTGSLLLFGVTDYATTTNTSSNPQSVGQIKFDNSQYEGAVFLTAILTATSSSVTSSIKLLNLDDQQFVEIDGVGDDTISLTSTTPTLVSSVDLTNAANFNALSSSNYELQLFTSDAAVPAIVGGASFEVTGQLIQNSTTADADWVDGGSQIRTTSSVAVSSQAEFASARGEDVYFFVSGTLTSGSATDNISVFGGSVRVSGNLAVGSDSTLITDNTIQVPAGSPNIHLKGDATQGIGIGSSDISIVRNNVDELRIVNLGARVRSELQIGSVNDGLVGSSNSVRIFSNNSQNLHVSPQGTAISKNGGANVSVEGIGDDVVFYVSGTQTSGSSTDRIAAFGGSVRVSGNLAVGTGSILITEDNIQVPASPSATTPVIFPKFDPAQGLGFLGGNPRIIRNNVDEFEVVNLGIRVRQEVQIGSTSEGIRGTSEQVGIFVNDLKNLVVSPSGVAISKNQNSVVTDVGRDVLFFVSGTFGSGSANDRVSVFGGDVRISGTLAVGTGSAFLKEDQLVFTSASIRNVGGELKFFDTKNLDGLTLETIDTATTTGSQLTFNVADFATTQQTSSNPETIGQLIFDPGEYSGPVHLRSVLSVTTGSVSASIKLLNATSGAFVEIGGTGNDTLSSNATAPTKVESVDLTNATNFSTASAIYELQAFISGDGSETAFVGGTDFVVTGTLVNKTVSEPDSDWTVSSSNGEPFLTTTSSIEYGGSDALHQSFVSASSTSDGTPLNFWTYTLASGTLADFDLTILARNDRDRKRFKRSFSAFNDGTVVNLLEDTIFVTVPDVSGTNTTGSIDVNFTTGSNSFTLHVTGASDRTTNWSLDADIFKGA